MVVQLEVDAHLGARLEREARKRGRDATSFIIELLESRLGAIPESPEIEERRLIEKIGEGLPEGDWLRFEELRERAQAGNLSDTQRHELLALTDRIEAMDARRVEHLAALSRLRGVPVAELMTELGIAPRLDG